MTMITRSELIALARVSNIDLTVEELENMLIRLAEVLQYAARVKEFADMYLCKMIVKIVMCYVLMFQSLLILILF